MKDEKAHSRKVIHRRGMEEFIFEPLVSADKRAEKHHKERH